MTKFIALTSPVSAMIKEFFSSTSGRDLDDYEEEVYEEAGVAICRPPLQIQQ